MPGMVEHQHISSRTSLRRRRVTTNAKDVKEAEKRHGRR
jgi:hypothetical protein